MDNINVTSTMDKLHVLHAGALLAQRDALAAGDKERAKGFRQSADQAKRVTKAAAKKHFGDDVGAAMSRQVDMMDARHRRLVKATGGTGLLDIIAKGGDKGKEAKEAFEALAHDDPLAKRMMNANVQAIAAGHHKSPAAAAKLSQFLPAKATGGAQLSPTDAQAILRKYIAVRGTGRPVQMRDFIAGHGYAYDETKTKPQT